MSPPISSLGEMFSTFTIGSNSSYDAWSLPWDINDLASVSAACHRTIVPLDTSIPAFERNCFNLSLTRFRRASFSSSVSGTNSPALIVFPPPYASLMLSGRGNTPHVLTDASDAPPRAPRSPPRSPSLSRVAARRSAASPPAPPSGRRRGTRRPPRA
eukprot:30873-Pelagococcus_subviridis.AAC.7